MDNWKMILLTAGISLIVSILTSWVTSKCAFKSDIKKYLYSKRETLYFELGECLDELLIDLSNVYEEDYKEKLYLFKPRVKLIASNGVVNDYKKIMNVYNKYYFKLQEFISKNDPTMDENNYEHVTNEFGEEDDMPHFDERDINNYEHSLEEFKENNYPQTQEIQRMINNIIDAMRKDLGNNKIEWSE